MRSDSLIRVGIVGLGRSGWGIHATALRAMPEHYRVVAVADPLDEGPAAGRARRSAEELGCEGYSSIDELLTDEAVELVVVASPNAFHAPQAIRSLQSGRHVLCEKPFGLTVADVDAMIAASQAAGKVLQPFQQRRYEPDFRKVMEVCRSGRLGEIQFARLCWHGFKRRWDWQTLTSMSGGALNNNGPHPIDHALELFGDGDPDVWCERRRCLCSGDAEDYLKIILTGEGKPTIEIELIDVVAYGQDRWLVCGTGGGLRGGSGHLEWKWVDFSTMPDRPVDPRPTPDRSYNSETMPWQQGEWQLETEADAGAGAAPAMQPVRDLYLDLWRTIREGAPQAITPQQVRRRVKVMEGARNAAPVRDVAATDAALA